ncbi:MAG: hypothetical protein B7Y39_19825 [Bdellovibrio sp. 28-41-41]|nr:MAG: hypothetical protein B7Y39_19825 [Bdellovibrio sp. 28-41-41]
MKKILLALITLILGSSISYGYAGSLMYMEYQNVMEGIYNDVKETTPDRLPDDVVFPGKPKQVALFYGKGTWGTGRSQLKNFLYSHGRSYKIIYEKDILSGSLNKGGYHTLIIPGGKSWIYNENLGAVGAQEILKFVNAGGNYIGICAGAFYATSHRQGPTSTPINYGIGLLNGIALDGTALKMAPFKTGMSDYKLALPNFKDSYRILLLGGPSLLYTEAEAKAKRIQVYSIFASNLPAMIAFEYGKGRVFLSGPHLEVEENQSIIGVKYRDPDSEWPIVEYVFTNHFRNPK